ncbi:hypothetical protein B0T16DRAFT_413136 [Cercophora newfieldiana]|uniref:Uncharacterized protein n=1 Tax=Cercophora newfieldiana TaxID=92897 RepID=A0AA39Y5B0_9PEZI|nr:hypothetical protein B0T16DRAFT_413136 [Cercophora newfieldiana]
MSDNCCDYSRSGFDNLASDPSPLSSLMRLLDTLDAETTRDVLGSEIPLYAILSHTWEEEVTFQQLEDPLSRSLSRSKKGYQKIKNPSAGDGFGYEGPGKRLTK